ncbi:MAG: PIN domain-containing protein [archaeon]
MPQRIYLDSNVLISLLRDEIDKSFRLLSAEAQQFFDYARKHGGILVLSDLFYKEIKDIIKLDKKSVNQFFFSVKVFFEETEFAEQDFRESKKLESFGVHYPDSLHAAIAIRTKCNSIATFNSKDFKGLREKIKVVEPRDFI